LAQRFSVTPYKIWPVTEKAPAVLGFWVAQRFTAAIQALNFDGFSRCGKSPAPSRTVTLGG